MRVLVVDLFCGAGGFSTGAAAAGAEIALAVDSWPDALGVHALNHASAAHWCEELGGDASAFSARVHAHLADAYGARDSFRLHVHASPPCQNFSTANGISDPSAGLRLVEWSIELMRALRPDSWTLEQVGNPRLRALAAQHNGKLVACADYGVPQSRKRLVLGTVDWARVETRVPAPVVDILRQVGDRDVPWEEYIQINRAGDVGNVAETAAAANI